MSQDSSRKKSARSHVVFLLLLGFLLVGGAYVYLRLTEERKPNRIKLGVVTWNQSAFWDPVLKGAVDAGQAQNAELVIIQSEPTLESQTKYVRELLAQGVQGIAISPNNPKAQAALLDEVAAKGVLVTFDSDAPDSKRRVFVGTDDYAAGHLAGEEVRGALPDGGAVIISVGSIDMANGRDRRQGLIDNLLDRTFKRDRAVDPADVPLKGQTYSIAATVTDGGDAAKSTQLVADAIKANPDVKCIVGLFGYSAPAALEAIEKAGKAGQIRVVAFDEHEGTQVGLESGAVYASILQDQYRCGFEAVRVLADEVRGVNERGPGGPRMTHFSILVLKKDNLQEFRDRRRIRVPASQPTTQAAAAN